MKLRDEHVRSYVDDIKMFGLLDLLTWKGSDIAPAWIGAHCPATRSDDKDLFSLAKFNRDHYLFYRALVERYVDKEGDILEVGCGSGSRAAMLARYAKEVSALDSDMVKISVGSILNNVQNMRWIFSEFEEWAKTNCETYDYVFCVEVIEHMELSKQKSFMKALIGKVKNGGRLLLTTPRDYMPDRKEPHIGLWDDGIAQARARDVGGEIRYFNVKRLKDGGENPWSNKEDSTHYVVVAGA